MDRLRAAPGAEIVLAAVAGEPGVLRGRRRGARRAARAATRASSTSWSRATRSPSRGAPPSARRRADRPRALRHRDRAHRRVRVRPRERAPRALRAAGRAARRRARRDDRGGPGAPRLHASTRSPSARRRRATRVAGRARGPRRRRPARPARRARSSTTRRGCCGSSATPPGSGFAPEPDTAALIDPALLATVTGDRAGRRAAAAAARAAAAALRAARALRARAGAARRAASRSTGWPSAPAPACSRSPPAARRSRARSSRARLDAARVPGARARRRGRRGGRRSSALRGSLDGGDADAVARCCAASAPETRRSCSPRPASAGARRWLDDLRHRRLAITGDDLLAAGLNGPAVGRALARATAALLDGRGAATARRSCARHGATSRCVRCPRRSAGRTTRSSPTCRTPAPSSRPAAAASRAGRSRR